MVVQVQKSGNTYSFTLTPQAAEELALVDGSAIDIRPAEAQPQKAIRYATLAEGMKAYEDTRAEFDEVYRELAK
jgi:antitoxin component of MazEF toxin-antitoxin module